VNPFKKEAVVVKKKDVLVVLLMTVLLAVTVKAQSISIPSDSVKGPMCVVLDTVKKLALPLSPTISTYNVIVTDGLAQITLTQKFVNDYGVIKDLVYVFPLPHEAAVHGMTMEYRDSIYIAKIFEKQEAQQIYDSIVKKGGTAALLLQDRPNVFQQRLANIAYHDTAFVQIKLTMPLSFNNGIYELAIPTMVSERYQSDGASPVPSSGRLWNPPPDRDGQSLRINVLVQTGFPIAQLQSPTHALTVSAFEAVRTELENRHVIEKTTNVDQPYASGALLTQATTYPNKDFVLRFSRAAATVDFTIASYYDTSLGMGYFYGAVFPDTSLFAGSRPKLDIVLLIDVSGSQEGWPLAKEKEISNLILDKLNSTDRISVLSFSDQVYWCFGSAQSAVASSDNIGKAKTFINALTTVGGTNLLSGVQAALAIPKDQNASRFFIFCTDGNVTNESAIIDAIKNHASSPTVFTFGAGNNLNRYFLDESAKVGNGYSTEITQNEAVDGFVNAAWNKIESPQLRNITITCGGLDNAQLLMPHGAILYKGSPVELCGVYSTGGKHTVQITGQRDSGTVILTKEIDLAAGPTGNAMIPQVWARQMIEKLRIEEGTTTVNKSRIIEISKAYQVLSDYTAFLAINPVAATDQNSIQKYVPALTKAESDVLSAFSMRINRGFLTLEMPAGVFLKEIEVYDMFGRCVFRKQIGSFSCGRFMWDGMLSGGMKLPKGHFIVKIMTTKGLIIRTMIWK
jgi:Ca-activated chloride channel homolog